MLCWIASLLGASGANYFPKSRADALFSELEGRGFSTDRHEHYWGGEAAYEASRLVIQDYSLPDDLSVIALDENSPRAMVAEVAALCQTCDVMPVPGPIMREQARRGINLVAIDTNGRPVATASSFATHHEAGPHPNDVFWGMLATREDRRGERIALILGAKAIVHMWEAETAKRFMTGVRRDNPSSQALCSRLSIKDSDWIYAWCLSADLSARKEVTK